MIGHREMAGFLTAKSATMDAADTRAIDERMMRRCLGLAVKSAELGEYPYGAVIVRDGEVVVETTNRVARDRDVTRHAEVVAISEAQKALASTDLGGCTLYTNVEPCALCSYAIRESRLARVVYAMRSPVMGGASRWNILSDPGLSDTMPEVFMPPPDIAPDVLSEEADAMLRRRAPVMWAFFHARGLIAASSQDVAGGEHAQGGRRSHGYIGLVRWLFRALRMKLADRFGRGRTR